MKPPSSFIAITSEGGLLPADFLHELPDPKTNIEGITPVEYHLAEGERLNEQINRSWNRLKGCWENFKKAIAAKQSGEPTTTDTRERWLLPLFQELGFGRVTIAKPIEVDGRSYPISHGWNQVPIHLVGSHADLDRRTPGAVGAAKASPHSLVQSALNASEDHLWGIVSNGFTVRLLRDNIALTRLAYVEFDLQAMFDGDLYSEFFVLWLVCHQSRFELDASSESRSANSAGADPHSPLSIRHSPHSCWLERWKKSAEDKTLRALDDLYPGVKKAIAALGAGLVSHHANQVLLEKLRTGRLTTQEFYKQVLRVIYRMLFLLVAEDRALLHPVPLAHRMGEGLGERTPRTSNAHGAPERTPAPLPGGERTPVPCTKGPLLGGVGVGRFMGRGTAVESSMYLPSSPQPSPPSDGGEGENTLNAFEQARRRYRDFYSITRLRALTRHRAGTPHPDLWHVFQFVTAKLGSDTGCPELALPPLGSFLWTAAQSTPDLLDSLISNRHFLEAVHALAFVQDGNVRRAVDYKNLGSEELGSVYQGLLEMHPRINADAGSFELDIAAGNERKTSGSYYTPDSLVQCLLDSALEPVIAERLAEARETAEKLAKAGQAQRTSKPSPSPPSEGGEGRGEVGSSPSQTTYSQLAEKALLSMKVCDKAVGSGHFLLRAAHRIARHLARVRSGEEESSPAVYRTALRDVIGHCLYGVDINPMAVELCKVTLWLEALEPGKPLSFLDHHIRCGNSLLGATPELISAGLPDGAFEAIEGDDKAACSSLKKLNRAQREGLRHLFIAEDTAIRERMHQAAAAIDEMSDSRPEDIRRKEAAFRAAQSNYDFGKAWDLANLWCAAFVIKKRMVNGESRMEVPAPTPEPAAADSPPLATQDDMFGGPATSARAKAKHSRPLAIRHSPLASPWGVTTQHLRDFVEGGALPDGLLAEAKRLADQYRFFHWHLAFPEVFAQSGFDVSLGNPPWERVKLQEKEWFAERRADIAEAPNAATRKRLIEALQKETPALFAEFQDALRQSDGEGYFMRNSGLYPLCARGDVNLYAVFAEGMRKHLAKAGSMGAVLPSGIATDDTTKRFFQDITDSSSLVSLFDFENRAALFPAVDSRMKFCLFTTREGGRQRGDSAQFVFFAQRVEDIRNIERRFTLTPDDIALVNPNSRTCPIFRFRRDAEIAKAIYRRIPVLLREGSANGNPWGVKFTTMFHMTNDGPLFRTRDTLEGEGFHLDGNCYRRAGEIWFPVLEGKMVGAYDHRAANIEIHADNALRQQQPELTSLAEREDPMFVNQPYLWAPEKDGRVRTPDDWNHEWFLAFKRVTAATNERTVIGCFIPWTTASYTLYLVTCARAHHDKLPCLGANLFSFLGDFLVRQKTSQPSLPMGVIYEAAFLPPAVYSEECRWLPGQTLRDWLLPRVLELTYTAWDLQAFANDCGCSSPPFRWNEERRFLLRCELDAAFFHLYGLNRSDGAYVLEAFPTVRRKDEDRFGHYRTAKVVLEIYDALADALRIGRAYETGLTPSPAHLSLCHSAKPNNRPPSA